MRRTFCQSLMGDQVVGSHHRSHRKEYQGWPLGTDLSVLKDLLEERAER